ncbi:c-type cytochrome [Yoonia sp.]|uniref:c-type cytochrome n=1 Tax=Yoonia sp. TaxID=2212373 RepID=UPI003A4D934F
MRRMIFCLVVLAGFGLPVAAQDLRGHGGPVGALDAGQGVLVSGGFDTRAILWDLDTATARNVTRFHDGNVTAVRLLPTGDFVTAGQDGRLVIWHADGRDPQFATAAGASAVASLGVSPDGAQVAAGYWDGRVLRLDLGTQQATEFQAHSDRVTGLGYLPDGDLVTVGGDLLLVRWTPQSDLAFRQSLPDLPNGLAITDSGVAVIFADGALRLYDDAGAFMAERFLADRPLVSVTARTDTIAAASVDGSVWLLASDDLTPRHTFTAAAGPVWALAMTDTQVFSSGADGVIRRWSLDGDDLERFVPDAAPAFDDGSRGAEVWKNCAVCHSLEPDDHSMAGPSLHGILGRPIATQSGYDYSEALQELDIIWTAETISELFTYGPETYTPGSRMPEQRIGAPEDREALVAYLQRVTDAQD